jgi:DNA-binding transcriptional LysR family regulator
VDIHQLKIFVSVYKNKSFTKASEQLHISQPTISEHIKNLEADLNVKLFDRLGRNISPTREAEILFPKVCQVLDDIENIEDTLHASSTEIKGKLIFGASTIPGTYILPQEAYSFKQQYPEVFFEIIIEDTSKITNMILNHELMCGFVGARIESDKLEFKPLIEDELILVAAKGLMDKKSIQLKDIFNIPFLLREKGSGTRQTLEYSLEYYLDEKYTGIDALNIVACLGSTGSIIQAVKNRLGASILSRIAVQEELTNGSLVEIPIEDLQMKRKFYLVHLKKRTLPAQYLAFCQHLKKTDSKS